MQRSGQCFIICHFSWTGFSNPHPLIAWNVKFSEWLIFCLDGNIWQQWQHLVIHVFREEDNTRKRTIYWGWWKLSQFHWRQRASYQVAGEIYMSWASVPSCILLTDNPDWKPMREKLKSKLIHTNSECKLRNLSLDLGYIRMWDWWTWSSSQEINGHF